MKKKAIKKINKSLRDLKEDNIYLKTTVLSSFSHFRNHIMNDVVLLFIDRQLNLNKEINKIEKEYNKCYLAYQLLKKTKKADGIQNPNCEKNNSNNTELITENKILKERIEGLNKKFEKLQDKYSEMRKERGSSDVLLFQSKKFKDIQDRERKLEKKERKIERRENSLNRKVKWYEQKKKKIDAQEKELNKKQKYLEKREKKFKKKENDLNRGKKSLEFEKNRGKTMKHKKSSGSITDVLFSKGPKSITNSIKNGIFEVKKN